MSQSSVLQLVRHCHSSRHTQGSGGKESHVSVGSTQIAEAVLCPCILISRSVKVPGHRGAACWSCCSHSLQYWYASIGQPVHLMQSAARHHSTVQYRYWGQVHHSYAMLSVAITVLILALLVLPADLFACPASLAVLCVQRCVCHTPAPAGGPAGGHTRHC